MPSWTASANSNSLSTHDLVANTAGNDIMTITSIKVDGDLGSSSENITIAIKEFNSSNTELTTLFTDILYGISDSNIPIDARVYTRSQEYVVPSSTPLVLSLNAVT